MLFFLLTPALFYHLTWLHSDFFFLSDVTDNQFSL